MISRFDSTTENFKISDDQPSPLSAYTGLIKVAIANLSMLQLNESPITDHQLFRTVEQQEGLT